MDADRERLKAQEALAKLAQGAQSFRDRARANAGIDLDELVDPDGEAIASLVDGEVTPGAALLVQPMDLLLFETWLLGHLGDHDEFDLDINTHQDIFFRFGAWLGELLKQRHGGTWLIAGDEPRAWRVGFSKIMLEIAPHAFAEKLLRSGAGLTARMLGEIERLREQHEEAVEQAGGQADDKFSGRDYARMHTVPFAQWMVLEMARLHGAWLKSPAAELASAVAQAGKKLPEQNQPVLAKIADELAKLPGDQPAAATCQDRRLFEAVGQVLALKRASRPIAVDVLEKLVLPAAHVGEPLKFPPLDEDELDAVKKGSDLFSVYLDVVPYAHRAVEDGFLSCFAPEELGTPYVDKQNLEVGRGDWLLVNPQRLRTLFESFEPRTVIKTFEKFVRYVAEQPSAPRVRETGLDLAKTAQEALLELRTLVRNVAPGCALVFRLLPPAG